MMRRYVAAFALAGLLASLAASQHALAQDSVDNTRRSMGNLRPGSPGAGYHAPAQHHVDNTRRSMGNLRPSPPAAQGPNRTIIVVPQPYYGGYGYPYYPGYGPYYPGGYGYYPYYGAPYPYYGPYVYPPVYVPPVPMYGAQGLRRFMGLGW